MTTERLSLDQMADMLAEWLAPGTTVSDEERRRASEALAAIGVPWLLAELELAERILRAGNGFHTIAGFFIDGSPEQDFLLSLGDAMPTPGSEGPAPLPT